MARYIDGDKLLKYYEERHKNLCKKNGETDAYCRGYEDAMYVAEHLDFTADVVPRSEVDLYRKQVDELEDELASVYDKLEKAKADVAREIFADIDTTLDKARRKYRDLLDSNGVIYTNYARAIIAELKKKYTEGEG